MRFIYLGGLVIRADNVSLTIIVPDTGLQIVSSTINRIRVE